MFQITADLSELDTEQRESLAAFILSFPRNNNFHGNSEPVIIPTFSVHSEEDEEQSPETAFATAAGPVLVHTPPAPTDAEAHLDKNGIPWDERIHSSSRVKTADGSWRRKRGLDETVAANVESELKALMGIPTPPPVAAVIPPAPAPIADTPAAVVAAVIPPPPAPPVGDKTSFVALIKKASDAIQAKKLTQEELTSAVVAAGVPSLPMLGHRMDLVPIVSDTIDAMVAGR